MNTMPQSLLCFDVETTGTDPCEDRIVTAALTLVGPGLEPVKHNWLVNPGIEIPPGAMRIHGITNEKAQRGGMPADEAVWAIQHQLFKYATNGTPLVVFNARYDLTMLEHECRRYNIEMEGDIEQLTIIDPLVIDKHVDRYRKGGRRLTDLCEHYNVQMNTAHRADDDAIAAGRLAWRLLQRYNQLNLSSIAGDQRTWAREQAISLQEYFERQGRHETVAQAWPCIR